MTIDITTRNLLIGLCSHMAYMQGQLEALHQLDDPDDHYWFRESVALQQKVADHLAAMADGPAVPEGREPVAVTGQPRPTEDDVEDAAQCIYEAMRFERVETTPAWSELGNSLAQDTARKAARAVLAHWGNPAPAPPVEGEWQTGLPSFAGFYYVRGLLDESIGGDNRPVYVNPKHFVWGFWEQDDPEWIGLDSDITPDNIQWKPVAPLPSPVADGEVAELVALLQEEADDYECIGCEDSVAKCKRAAELLQRQTMPEVGE